MRKLSVAKVMALVASIVLTLAACGPAQPSGPTEVHGKLSEFKIELDKTSIPAGPVKFIFDNVGKEKHEVVLELAGDNDKPIEVNGKASEVEDIEPGKTATLEWTIDQPGEYQLGCHINENNEDHYASGMVAKFTVTK